MAVDFSDYFWGEKNEGFGVLYANMKCGILAIKELADFLKERAKLEEENSKAHAKLSKQLNNGSACGSFSPMLFALKISTDKLSNIHNQWTHKLLDLVKDVTKYSDDLHKTHKQVKDEESATSDSVKVLQDTTLLLQKTKEIYKQRCLELEKLKRDNGSTKGLEKSEAKFRKAQEDYKNQVDKYCLIRDDFERKMTLAAKRFQDVEGAHLKLMREFVESYCQIVDNNNNQVGRVYQEFQIQLTELTVENLLEQFTISKHTGLEKPGPVEFDEEKISIASATGPPSDISERSGGSNDKAATTNNPLVTTAAPTPATTNTTGRKMTTIVADSCSRTWSRTTTRSARNSSSGGNSNSNNKTRAASLLNLFIPSSSNNNNNTSTNSRLTPPPPSLTSSSSNLCCPPSAGSAPTTAEDSQSTLTANAASVVGLLDISIPVESTTTQTDGTALDFEGLSGANTNHTTVAGVTTTHSEEDANSLNQEQLNSSPGRSPHASKAGWTVTGFLKRNRKKGDKRKKISTASVVNKDDVAGDDVTTKEMGSDGEDNRKSETPTPEVDDEGFSKQPATKTGPSDPWADFNQPSKNFYSSSDDSDDESKRKIKVEIKPVRANGAATPSFDELSSVIGKLELAPPPIVPKARPKSALNDRIYSGAMTLRSKTRELRAQTDSEGIRRSQSQNQINLPSQDLLGLSLHPIDPIDGSPDGDKSVPKHDNLSESAFNSAPFVADFSKVVNSSIQQLDTSTTSKEVQDIMGDFSNEQQPALPPKINPNQVQRERITNSLIALPRPPSRMGAPATRPRGSPSPSPAETLRRISRNDSSASGDVKTSDRPPSTTPPMLPISTSNSRSDFDAFRTPYGISRGPSPLTLGMSDVVPLAVAFQEVCHVCFRGVDESNCQVRLIGDMMISFPAGIVQVVATNPNPSPLMFRIKNSDLIESVVANKHLISLSDSLSTAETKVFEFDMKSLKDLLRKQAEQNPHASYFNLDLLKYQVKAKAGAGSCPLQMVAYWKCTDSHTDLRLDYKYNGHAMASPCPLLNLSIAVPVGGGVTNMQSQPTGMWISESSRALWKFNELSQHNNGGVGSLRGRFQLTSGPGSQGTIAAQFNCEGTTLSGIDFELVGHGYRLSLVKRRFVSGKYICDGDASTDNRYRYAAPQTINTNYLDGPSEC